LNVMQLLECPKTNYYAFALQWQIGSKPQAKPQRLENRKSLDPHFH
jgi:hypothetical protein